MKFYSTFLDLGSFTLQDICYLFPTKKAAQNKLSRYMNKGLVERVKRNYYVTMDIVHLEPVLTKFVIASKMDSSNYISYHSALEYYGYFNQVMNEIIYCGRKSRDFFFEGINYHFVDNKCSLQIIENQDGSKVTTLERTVIDCMNQLFLAGGIEELYRALDMISFLDERLMIEMLDFYHKKSLYQRAGFIFSYFQESLHISDEFLSYLHSKIDRSVSYLIPSKKDFDTYFDSTWNICVPTYVSKILNKGF